jgi:cytochrome c2
MSAVFLRRRMGPAMLAVVFLVVTGRAHAEGDGAHGEKLFEECAACHSTARGDNKMGPSLSGLFERKAGELDDFRYSPALKRSGIAWTPDTLDAFIADPQKAVPANRMPYAGMPDAANRTDLIAYLRKATK